MAMKQHPLQAPYPITDDMTRDAPGAGAHELVGTVVTAYEIPDSDRRETLLLFDDGKVVLVSCDPVRHDDDGMWLPEAQWGERWEVVLYDATETRAGRAMKDLAPGHWL